jgi:hypothetical protein
MLDINRLIKAILITINNCPMISEIDELFPEANDIRELTKERLLNGFDPVIFYAPLDNARVISPERRDSLFYQLVYGPESKLAGSGLRESHFQTVFSQSEQVISYIYPQMINRPAWNFEDEVSFSEFCNGIFNKFNIRNYVEVMPIRLASYFHQDYLFPIFKLSHLEMIWSDFGFQTNDGTRGGRLFKYNSFLRNQLNTILTEQMNAILHDQRYAALHDHIRPLPFNNYINSNIAYQVHYSNVVHNRQMNGETFDAILVSYKKKWEKNLITCAGQVLEIYIQM